MIVSEINIKLVIFGLGGVGKTSIVNSFLGQQISTKYFPTIGSSISKKEYRLPKHLIRVNIWDIGGQRAFNPLNPVFFTNNDAAFLVFDLSNSEESIKELRDVYLPSLVEKSENCIILVLGNKLDLITNDEELRKVTRENEIHSLPLAYVSALENKNIKEVFELIVYNVLLDIESMRPSKKIAGVAEAFLTHIGKKKEDLERVLINKGEVDTLNLEDITVSKEEEVAVGTGEDLIPFEIERVPPARPLREDIADRLDEYLEKLLEYNTKMLNWIKDKVLNLKKTPIDQLDQLIDMTANEVESFKDDFEHHVKKIFKPEEVEEMEAKSE